MSKTSEVIADIGGILEESGLQWNISYIPSTKSYSIYISDEEVDDKHIRPCSTCKNWGGPDSLICVNCTDQDNWEPEAPEKKYNPVQKAYDMLVNARDNGGTVDADYLIGYLGEALDE